MSYLQDIYRYSWDKEDLQTYPWPRNYVTQEEILKYLNHVVDKHGLREHMQFSTELVAAQWDDVSQRWHIECGNGATFTTKYLITCLGLLTRKKDPGIPGALDGTFQGKLMHSSEWDPAVDVTGQRVGLIGCGSTGIQITVAIADKVKELRAFIRHPQYTVPTGLREVSGEERQKINRSYDEIFRRARESSTAFAVDEAQRETSESRLYLHLSSASFPAPSPSQTSASAHVFFCREPFQAIPKLPKVNHNYHSLAGLMSM